MNIERGPRKDRGFVIIDNALLQDNGLSFGARGLGAYLLSLPTGARVDIRSLAARNPEGRTAIAGYMRELESARYLVRTSRQGEGGRFATACTMHEEPQDPALTPASLPKPWSKAKRSGRPLAAVPEEPDLETFSQVTPNPVKPASGVPAPGRPGAGKTGVNPSGVKEPGKRTSSSPARETAGPGGGGGDAPQQQENERAAGFVDTLPFGGRIPGPKQRAHLIARVAAAFADGWAEVPLRQQLTADTSTAKSLSAVYRYRLETEQLPPAPAAVLPEQRVAAARPHCPECERPLTTGSAATVCRDCRDGHAAVGG